MENLNLCLGQKERLQLDCHGKVASRSLGASEELIGKEKRSQFRRKWNDLIWWFWQKQMGHYKKGEVVV